MTRTTSLVLGLTLVLSLGGCSSMLGMLNPLTKKPSIDVTAQVGKTNIKEDRTQLAEIKSISTVKNANEAEVINQAYTNIEPWLVLLIALGFGLALPSPTAWYSHARETRFLRKQLDILQGQHYDFQKEFAKSYRMQEQRLHEERIVKEKKGGSTDSI